MKLYSTVTSERASKSQGGNEYLHIHVTVGSKDDPVTILKAEVEHTEQEGNDIYTLYNGDMLADCITIPKGKKQKGESCLTCSSTGWISSTEPCLNCNPKGLHGEQ